MALTSEALLACLNEIVYAITTGDRSELTMRIPAEPDRDADLVITEAAQRLAYRFAEEALELVQACGASKEDVLRLVEYVYDRSMGEPAQEVGGVMVTLAALCFCNQIDLGSAAETELERVWQKIEKIRAKQAAKPEGVRSPLPGEEPSNDD